MKVVIDTNVLLQSIGRKSRHRPIWDAIIEGKFVVVISNLILSEYEEIVGTRTSKLVAELVLNTLLEIEDTTLINPDFYWNAITNDPDDNKFFDAAVASSADYIVTNDGHFNILKQLSFPKIAVISADDFLLLLDDLQEFS